MITVGIVPGGHTGSDNRFLCVNGLGPLVEAISLFGKMDAKLGAYLALLILRIAYLCLWSKFTL